MAKIYNGNIQSIIESYNKVFGWKNQHILIKLLKAIVLILLRK